MIRNQIILTLDLKEGTILLNEGLVEALDRPRQIQIMINKETKMLLLRACTVADKWAVVMPTEQEEQYEISGRGLLQGIRTLLGWNDYQPRMCYGEYLPTHQAVRFDLTAAEPLDFMIS